MNRYFALIIALLATGEMKALQQAPRLVVNITIDQLRSDLLDAFSDKYSDEGFNRLLQHGTVFTNAHFSFTPVDIASASAAIATGTTPFYNGIVGTRWLDRNTLRPTLCIADSKHFFSPDQMLTSTIGDELKLATAGKAIVWSIAERADAAILSAGHAADGAIWLDSNGQNWKTSTYYGTTIPTWLKAYNITFETSTRQEEAQSSSNEKISNLALQTVKATSMGLDNTTDYLSVTLSASFLTNYVSRTWKENAETIYRQLDTTLGELISNIERYVGKENVIFVLSGTGYENIPSSDLSAYRIPTGTLNITRTINLLNMYLSAIYGQGRYAQACYERNIYIDHKLLEQKQLDLSEVLKKSQAFLVQTSGISDAYTISRLLSDGNGIERVRNGYCSDKNGDIIVEIAPGWQLYNEDTHEILPYNNAFATYPIIFYGSAFASQKITIPVKSESIAATIAASIHIRAPNGSRVSGLF